MKIFQRFRFNRWQIAYRKQGERQFSLISNPSWAWAADPFLIEYHGELYLFAELYLWKTERNGVIGFCKYKDGNFTEWEVALDFHWHLSYPNVFYVGDDIYMCPESHQSEEVCVYKAVEFPYKWEKYIILEKNVKFVDTTFCEYNGRRYMFTFRPTFKNYGGELLLTNIDNETGIFKYNVITSDVTKARPGGNVLVTDSKIIRVSQNCKGGYGKGLVFSEILSFEPSYEEKIIKQVCVDDIVTNSKRKFIGLHTYNCLAGIEVIDLKYQTFSVREFWARKRVRKIFLNKYH